ncbi:MAG: DUF4907 domain-containing protein [Bacteroidales bacterium]|nr:DUF4907 domain-containing protein [Bacteroidales bacterium]
MKNSILLIFLLLFVFLINACKTEVKQELFNANDSSLITTEVIDLDTGWGYAIYKDDVLFIYQTAIPAVNGHFLFSSPEKALITANFVAYKMTQKNGLPSVYIEELDSLGVLDSNVLKFQEIDYTTTHGIVPHGE